MVIEFLIIKTTERMILLQREYDCIMQHHPERLEVNILTESLFFACFCVLSKGLTCNPDPIEKVKDTEKNLRSMIVQAYEEVYHEKLSSKLE